MERTQGGQNHSFAAQLLQMAAWKIFLSLGDDVAAL
jgi:hypothetical protein